jgi:hypothetical protein
MAIEEYGASLLSNVRERRDNQAKRLQREQEQGALMGLGVTAGLTVGNNYLKNKAEQFFNNKENLDKRVQFRTAMADGRQAFLDEQNFQQKGMSYFREMRRADVERYTKMKFQQENPNYSEAQRQAFAEQYLETATQEAYENHQRRLEAAKKLTTLAGADGVEAYDRQLLKMRPTDVPSAFIKAMTSAVTGDANESMHNANLANLGGAAEEYMKIYREIQNPYAAREILDANIGPISEQPLTYDTFNVSGILDPDTGERYTATYRTAKTRAGQTVFTQDLSNQGKLVSLSPRQNPNSPVNPLRTSLTVAMAAKESIQQYGLEEDHEAIKEGFIDTFGSSDDIDQKIKDARLKTFYATGHHLHKAVTARIPGLSRQQAWQVTSRMMALNFNSGLDFDLLATDDGYSPVLAIAALDSLGNKDRAALSRRQTNQLIGTVAAGMNRDVVQSFQNLPMVQRKKLLYWMKDNAPFFGTARVANTGNTYLEQFKLDFATLR